MKMGFRSLMATLAVVVLLTAWRVPAGAQCTPTTTTTSTTIQSGCFQDWGDGTIRDTCTGLQWEKKDGDDGTPNAADLHDVDNHYWWAGFCNVTTTKYCQPNAAAETACKAQTAAAYWGDGCEQCVGGEGTCTVGASAITTVWGWVSQVNTANFAGYSDWRLPSEDGCNSCWTGFPTFSCPCTAHELGTILLAPYPCGTTPCIASIFGPVGFLYWSATTNATLPRNAWFVSFDNGLVDFDSKFFDLLVRAVRAGS